MQVGEQKPHEAEVACGGEHIGLLVVVHGVAVNSSDCPLANLFVIRTAASEELTRAAHRPPSLIGHGEYTFFVCNKLRTIFLCGVEDSSEILCQRRKQPSVGPAH